MARKKATTDGKIHHTEKPGRLFDANESPTVWFVNLENAIRTGKFAAAAKAEANLKRLGVYVRFTSKAIDLLTRSTRHADVNHAN